MTKKIIVQGELLSVSSQRQQYKPYGYELAFERVKVELELSPEQVISQSADETVINVDGFKAILGKLADAVDEVHDEYVAKARRAGKF